MSFVEQLAQLGEDLPLSQLVLLAFRVGLSEDVLPKLRLPRWPSCQAILVPFFVFKLGGGPFGSVAAWRRRMSMDAFHITTLEQHAVTNKHPARIRSKNSTTVVPESSLLAVAVSSHSLG